VGIDFADGMLKLATEHAQKVGVGDRCKFMVADFYTYQPEELFDYVIVMGFMDYMPDAEKVVAKVLSLTRKKAFFSFPVAGGMLGWQRQMRYKKRCDLFLYTEPQLKALCAKFPEAKATIEPISRDYFVTLEKNGQKM
jgi:ubiquinone/menaquinone biosynthesis C-methylase UbiE